MCLKIILRVTKNQGLTFSLEDTFFKKLQGMAGEVVEGVKMTLHSSQPF